MADIVTPLDSRAMRSPMKVPGAVRSISGFGSVRAHTGSEGL